MTEKEGGVTARRIGVAAQSHELTWERHSPEWRFEGRQGRL